MSYSIRAKMMMKVATRRCVVCSDPIPKARLRILPDTRTCVGCSDVPLINEHDIQLDGTDPDDLIDQAPYPDYQ